MIYGWIILLAALIAGCFGLEMHGHKRGVDETEARYEAQAAEANIEARRLEIKRAGQAQGVTDAYIQAKTQSAADAAGARDELARLRNALSHGPAGAEPDASCRADAERIASLERLLRESAELAEEGGRRVADLDAKTTALQSYVARVCTDRETVGPPNPKGLP